jgi:hypothetical protein
MRYTVSELISLVDKRDRLAESLRMLQEQIQVFAKQIGTGEYEIDEHSNLFIEKKTRHVVNWQEICREKIPAPVLRAMAKREPYAYDVTYTSVRKGE